MAPVAKRLDINGVQISTLRQGQASQGARPRWWCSSVEQSGLDARPQ